MFSVLIPSYNHRPFLTDCILSALKSNLVSEVLLVDDGSSDRSSELFDFLKHIDRRIRVLPNLSGENWGAHARLNQLVDAAINDWVAPLNSDDSFVSGRFEAIQRIATRGTADLLFGDLILINDQSSRLGFRNAICHNEVPWPPKWDLTAMIRNCEWLPLLLLQNITATTTNMVFTKKIHAELGGFRAFRYCHDWDFVLRAAMQARVHYVPAMLAFYRLHSSNTIKESADRVSYEVRRMLTTLVAESSSLRNDPILMRTLDANHYISPPGLSILAIVLSDPLSRGMLQEEVAAARLPILLVTSAAEVPLEIPYLYQPGPMGAMLLRLNDIRQILLALAVCSYDALLLVRHAAEKIDEAGLADALVLRRAAVGHWKSGAVRSVRLYPTSGSEPVGPAITASSAFPPTLGVNVPLAASLLDCDPRPVVFILPAFLAVGGVERLALETMRHLGDRWRFVVVTTEPLRPEQGSTHVEALQLAPVYDLAELARPEDRLRSLELLRDWHAPALVWIMNGAPWQIDHAAEIRRVFHSIPIIDHQAYDHEAGWINRFSDSGVRAADRFIAINQKIRSTMQERFDILPAQIDLVYHGSDMSRVQRCDVDADTVAKHRQHFGLDPDRPVFGMVGRLTAQKRPLDLVALAKRIGKNVQFVWVGLGELEAEVKAAMKPLPNITLISNQSDLRPIYEMLDGMIITSEFEGLPIVFIEALAMGLPVLSTDVGAIKEVLDQYGSGLTFGPPGNIRELERAFKEFRNMLPELRRTAERQAAQVAEDFSSTRMAREYEVSFQQAIRDFRVAS